MSRDRLITYAKAVLARAEEDAAQYSHAYADEEIQRDIDALEEAEEAAEAESEMANQ
jgi:hypothetical protein